MMESARRAAVVMGGLQAYELYVLIAHNVVVLRGGWPTLLIFTIFFRLSCKWRSLDEPAPVWRLCHAGENATGVALRPGPTWVAVH